MGASIIIFSNKDNAKKILSKTGMKEFAELSFSEENGFRYVITRQHIAEQNQAIYAHLANAKILYIGRSKYSLADRLKKHTKWAQDSIRGKTAAANAERNLREKERAERWRDELLRTGGKDEVWGRSGLIRKTPYGAINIYKSEESYLIELYSPPLNSSTSI
ncbi:MAG: hypothetical protein AAGC95_17160 [Pseudomonadota bacterium]